jgi:N6-adenosine-specific RNA methylase IME4
VTACPPAASVLPERCTNLDFLIASGEKFGAILADPPWMFRTWSDKGKDRSAENHYPVMGLDAIAALPVRELAANDCVLFLWSTWPTIQQAFRVIDSWGFTYKSCAFDWMKADASQMDMFRDDVDVQIGLGFWTRANTEPCLLATRGKPKRLNADVPQAIIEPRRQHSRKPDCVYARIERLVGGPYIELFARQQRPGSAAWGNEIDRFDPLIDIRESVAEGFRIIRERQAAGGPGWGEHSDYPDMPLCLRRRPIADGDAP